DLPGWRRCHRIARLARVADCLTAACGCAEHEMPPTQVELGLQPSILDRLIDPESAGTAILVGYDERKMLAAVRRDLEELLNTRQTHVGYNEAHARAYPELNRSILTYGLPDLVTLEAITSRQR